MLAARGMAIGSTLFQMLEFCSRL